MKDALNVYQFCPTEEEECAECGWKNTSFYVVASDSGEIMCADCFMEKHWRGLNYEEQF